MRQKFGLHIDSQCGCDYEAVCASVEDFGIGCMGSHGIYPRLIALWEAIVYPKDPHSKWHA
jgi:hypothetical protein